jgi:hypothetical protein
MKKIMKAVSIFALVVITTSTPNLSAIHRKNRQQQAHRARQQQFKSNQQKQLQQISASQKQMLAQNSKNLVDDTKALDKKIQTINNTKNPQEKESAKEDIYELALKLLADLKEERSLTHDIYHGYTETQVLLARKNIEKLAPMEIKITKELEKKKTERAPLATENMLWRNSALPGKETEYDKLSLDITKLENQLKRIKSAIKDQNTVAGERWSKAYIALCTAGAVVSIALGADIILYGGSHTAALAGKAVALAKGGWNMLPSFRSTALPNITVSNTVATMDGKVIEKTAITETFGKTLANATWATLALTKEVVVHHAIGSALSIPFGLAVNHFYALLEDPDTTPEELKAQNQKVNDLAQKIKTETPQKTK